jgi:hypothetical protein
VIREPFVATCSVQLAIEQVPDHACSLCKKGLARKIEPEELVKNASRGIIPPSFVPNFLEFMPNTNKNPIRSGHCLAIHQKMSVQIRRTRETDCFLNSSRFCSIAGDS